MYVITAHQRHGRTDGRTSSDPMTATLLKHVAVKRTWRIFFKVLLNTVKEMDGPLTKAGVSKFGKRLGSYAPCSF